MKLFIVLAVVAFTAVLGKDPTKVCLPDAYQSDFYSPVTDDFGHLAIDFQKEVIGIQYMQTGLRVVYNLTSFAGYVVNTTDQVCRQLSAGSSIRNVLTKCLPATAKLLANTTKIGVPPNSVEIEGWELNNGIGVTRVALTTGSVVVPVLREFRINGTISEVSFYTNQQLSITHTTIFNIPSVCPPISVVGKREYDIRRFI